MKGMSMRWVFLATGLIGLVSLLGSTAWAKTPGGGTPSCLVKNFKKPFRIIGTVAINSIPGDPASVDVIARLQHNYRFGFFRLHMDIGINGLTNEEVACRIFNPFDTNDEATQAAVQAFVDDILAFFNVSGRTLVIADWSINKAEVDAAIDPTPYPGGTNFGSMGDIILHAQ